MKIKNILIPLTVIQIVSLAAPQARAAEVIEKPPYYLSVGEQKLIRVPDLQKYSLGGEAAHVLQTPIHARQNAKEFLLIKGVRPGPSDLWTWDSHGNSEHRLIRVTQTTQDVLKPELARALEDLSSVEIYFSGSVVTLRGEIDSLREAIRLQAIALAFPKEVQLETEPTESLLQEGQTRLEHWLSTSNYKQKLILVREDRSLRLALAPGSGLSGPSEMSRIEKRAKAIFPLVQLELQSLPDSNPTVHFNVFLLELKKSRFHTLGLGWPAAQEGAFQVSTSQISNLLQLNLTLNTLEGEGSLRVLSNPELVVRAPGEAELFSGGEIPIEAHSAYFSSITWKSFGLMLKLNVTQAAGDRVRLDISTEVSHLDPTLATDKVPGLQANRMKTQVDALYERPLLLSGLLQQNLRKEAKGLPLLRDIPILGALFGSDDYLNEKSELVAILVPSIHLPPRAHPYDTASRASSLPRGNLPPAREPSNPQLERSEEQDPDFPWNVL